MDVNSYRTVEFPAVVTYQSFPGPKRQIPSALDMVLEMDRAQG